MDAVEFAEWQAYYRICPFGDDWAQTDLLAWTLFQVNAGRAADGIKMGSFLPRRFGRGITEDLRPAVNPDVGKKLMAYFKAHGVTNGG
jgi:hypothetical protein